MATGKWKSLVANALQKNPNPFSQKATRDRVSLAIVLLTSSAAAFLPPEPTGRDIIHIILRVSLIFAFSFGFSSMFLRYYQKPKAAKVFEISAAIWMSSASAMFLFQFLR